MPPKKDNKDKGGGKDKGKAAGGAKGGKQDKGEGIKLEIGKEKKEEDLGLPSQRRF